VPFLVAEVGARELEDPRFLKFDYYLDESIVTYAASYDWRATAGNVSPIVAGATFSVGEPV
jgi:hypothetical protein